MQIVCFNILPLKNFIIYEMISVFCANEYDKNADEIEEKKKVIFAENYILQTLIRFNPRKSKR